MEFSNNYSLVERSRPFQEFCAGSRAHNTVTDPPGLEMIKMFEGEDEEDTGQCFLASFDRRFP